ncbi:hypothetical protein WA556_005610 [Blastocystis sp. ATCC 50177/Nand II]
MRFSLVLFVLLAVLADGVQAGSKLYMSDCGDSSYLLHYQNCKATDFERGKPVVVESEKELLKANITTGKVHLKCMRNSMTVFSHDFGYCGYQEAELPLWLGKIKYAGSDCSKPRPFEDSFRMSVTMPKITPGGKYEFSLIGEGPKGEKLFCWSGYTNL